MYFSLLIKFTAKRQGTGDRLERRRCCFSWTHLPAPFHLLTRSQTQPAPPQRQTCETSFIELYQKKCHAAKWPVTTILNQSPDLIWTIHKCLHEKVKVGKTTKDSWNGCVSLLTQKKKKNERGGKKKK